VTRRKRHRLAWEGLAWAVALFPLGQLALAVTLERDRLPVRDPEFTRKITRLDRLRHADPGRPLLVALGSSRTLQGLRADQLDGLPAPDGRPCTAFNLGLTAAGPLREWLALQRLLAAGVRPARLLVEVTPELLNEPGDGRLSEEAWLAVRTLAGEDLHRAGPYLERPRRLAHDWFNARVMAGYSYRRGWADRLLAALGAARRPDPMDLHGWQPFKTRVVPTNDRRRLVQMSLKQYAAAFRDYRVGAGPERVLRDLLARCRSEGIPTVLVLMPESRSFRCRLGASGVAGVQTLVTDLSLRTGCAVIDARAWIRDDQFWDAHHLIQDGATAFTRRLRAELERKFLGTEDGDGPSSF
jgi:hypothetical protein